MKILSPAEIRALLRDRNFSKVARACKLSPDTLYRLRNGEGSPSLATLTVLTAYFTGGTNGQT
jgi:DNA-binding phage protein